jgi:hypothetical protein
MAKRKARISKYLTNDLCPEGHDIRNKETALVRHYKRDNDGVIFQVNFRCRACWNETVKGHMRKHRGEKVVGI